MSDWKLAKRSARYLKDTKSLKLVMQVSVKSGDEVAIESWSDADFADDKDNMKSATRVVEAIDGAVVQWVCKKQTDVALSTMEVGFTSTSHVGRELLGLQELMRELGFRVVQPVSMKTDNQAAIKHLEPKQSIASAKYVNFRVKFICDYARKPIIKPEYMESRLMMAVW
ncbi:hypothetical protein PC121_g11432 [Phytophthora cactorum]|nr:hypothetical protein PC120_g11223 [Phytophthora cactorum]KAG3065199.1 hypothetical protein PC121_g11432 [Phytophthora cactorum]KAG4054877.1 hypothetical protein PC123_g10013 [Phytophthora cactorum]